MDTQGKIRALIAGTELDDTEYIRRIGDCPSFHDGGIGGDLWRMYCEIADGIPYLGYLITILLIIAGFAAYAAWWSS